MKKLILSIALVAAAATTAFAQIDGLSVGAGYLSNNHKASYTSGSTTYENTQNFGGFYVGASYNVFSFGPGVNIVPGIYFASLSYKNGPDSFGITERGKESYITVPVNFSYKLDLVPGTLAIEPYVGPTFALGLSSKGIAETGSTKNTTDMYGDDYKYGRFDLLLGGGLALDIVDMIRVSVGYNFGIIDRDGNDNSKLTTEGLNFGVAYLF